MYHCMDVNATTKRLRRIEGQVRGIIRMLEEEKSCEDILIQIGAVKSALHKTGQTILEGHLRHCVLDIAHDGDGEARLKKMIASVEQFSRTI